ncbi:MAG: hypothetical protein ACTSUE_22540 [Promethearchaeota archaeon]
MMLQSIDTGATAWILSAICLVLIMTPGLALFYGGLLRKKNVLSMFAYCFLSIVLTSVAWFFYFTWFGFWRDSWWNHWKSTSIPWIV